MKLLKGNISKYLEYQVKDELEQIVQMIDKWFQTHTNTPFTYVEYECVRFDQSIPLNKKLDYDTWRESALILYALKGILSIIYDFKVKNPIVYDNGNRIFQTDIFTKTRDKLIKELELLKEKDYEL